MMSCVMEKVSKFLQYRNQNSIKLSKIFMYHNLAMGLGAYIWLAAAINFIGDELVVNGHFGFERLRGALLSLCIFLVIGMTTVSGVGVYISQYRKVHTCIIIMWALFVFGPIMIPLFTTGTSLLAIRNMPISDVNFCRSGGDTHTSKWTKEMLFAARRFDYMSNHILNEHMCSNVCPCLDQEDEKYSPKLNYDMLMEQNKASNLVLAKSKLKARMYVEPKYTRNLVWTTDKTKGFLSFMDCYQSWEDKAEKDSSIDLQKIFNAYGKKDEYKAFKGTKKGDRIDGDGLGTLDIITHAKEYEMYQLLEDDYNCSGMCQPGIFYFSNPITYGPPERTCQLEFIEKMQQTSRPVAILSILMGIQYLVLFFLHFTMYQRPSFQEAWEIENNQQPQYVGVAQQRHRAEQVPADSIDQSIENNPERGIEMGDVQVLGVNDRGQN